MVIQTLSIRSIRIAHNEFRQLKILLENETFVHITI